MHRIAYFAHTGNTSGPNNSLIQLLRALDRRQFEPITYFPSDGVTVDELSSLGEPHWLIPTRRIEPSTGPRHYPTYVADLFHKTWVVRCSLRREQVNLVHINTSVTPYPGLAARSLGIPIIWHVRENLRRSVANDWYLATITALAHQVVAVSNAMRRQMLARPRVRPDKVCVIHNGIDADLFDRESQTGKTHAELGLPPGRKLIVVPAFLERRKGHEVLLEATSLLVHIFGLKNFCVLLIGEEPAPEKGRFTASLQAYCEAHHLSEHVRFLGLRRDVPALLVQSDIVCLPSIYDDPLPRAVLEGMAAGKPVVGTQVGGIPEMIDKGRTGLLVPCGRADALAYALADLINDERKAARLGREGRLRVEREFTSQIHAQHMQSLYRQILCQ